MAPSGNRNGETGRIGEIMEAIRDHHGQIDVRIEHLSLKLPRLEEAVELSGQISLTVHLRGISDDERRALTAKEIKALGGT